MGIALRTHFQQNPLHRFPWLPFTFVDNYDLRMRMYLQHRVCFPFAVTGVKVYLLNFWRPIVHVLFY